MKKIRIVLEDYWTWRTKHDDFFKFVNDMLQNIHFQWLPLSNIPRRLLHKYLLFNVIIKKGIKNI